MEISIDVGAGDRVSSLVLAKSTHGEYLGTIILTTVSTEGKVQTLNYGGGSMLKARQYEAQLGGGLICGFSARNGDYMDAFGLVFLQKVRERTHKLWMVSVQCPCFLT